MGCHLNCFMLIMDKSLVLLLLSAVTGLASACSSSSPCEFDLDSNLPTWLPILLDSNDGWWLPTQTSSSSSRLLTADEACSTYTLLCPGSGNYVNITKDYEEEATCVQGGYFEVEGASDAFKQLTCNAKPAESIVRTGNTCLGSYTEIQIGYTTTTTASDGASLAYPLITICHDESVDNTLYSEHVIYGSAINASDTGYGRPSFKKSEFYKDCSPSTAYKESNQISIFNAAFGETLGTQYIQTSKSLYFAKGHLAPDGDQIYVAFQNATYYFVNANPQWQSINNGNWKAIETGIRKKAYEVTGDKPEGSTYYARTGGYDILALPDLNGNDIKIYLTTSESDSSEQRIQAPKYLWKVIHDKEAEEAIAFVTLNNPHATELPTDFPCTDICDQVSWVSSWSWHRTNFTKGYSICCTAADLYATVPTAPDLGDLPVIS